MTHHAYDVEVLIAEEWWMLTDAVVAQVDGGWLEVQFGIARGAQAKQLDGVRLRVNGREAQSVVCMDGGTIGFPRVRATFRVLI